MHLIKKCFHCGIYTLKDRCPICGEKTRTPHPPKFSPEDKYGKYRRMAKKRKSNEILNFLRSR
ncbi:MAG: RNA-protein complex protein Nop10 [Candidatus Aenigmarchaeota archaeon]|nr:RNA-protein complex protein Nop10 [Candidatus Aenigmarchaeota archaeon]